MSDEWEIESLNLLFEDDAASVSIEFSQERIDKEIVRWLMLRASWVGKAQPTSQRCYTPDEKRALPAPLREYLASQEAAGALTPEVREWVIDSALDFAQLSGWDEVPMYLLTATLFLLQGISGCSDGSIPCTWKTSQVDHLGCH